MLEGADLHVRPSQKGWSVRTTESYLRSRPNLVAAKALVAPGEDPSNFSAVPVGPSGITFDATNLSTSVPPPPQRPEFLDLLNYGRLAVTVADESAVASEAAIFLEKIRGVTADGTVVPLFPHSALYALVPNRALYLRAKLPQVMVRLAVDTHFDPGHAKSMLEQGDTVFRSAQGLAEGIYMLDAYLGPLLAALSPGVWCIAVPRDVPILLSFGTQVSGTTALAADLLSTILRPGADRRVELHKLDSAAAPAAIEWWADALNSMFSVLSDPSAFTDADGTYEPIRQLESLLTIEQLFRRITSIRLNHQDAHAARSLLFSVLDTFETVLGWNLRIMFSVRFAAKTLDRIRGTIPNAAQGILLPACERAVVALHEVGRGFFLTDEEGLIPRGTGNTAYPIDDATAEFLRVLRNATHGFGPRKGNAAQLALATELLARHDGHLPSDLALLGHLYLVALLLDPERLRNTLGARRLPGQRSS